MSKPDKRPSRPAADATSQAATAQAPVKTELPAPKRIERRKHPLLLAGAGLLLVIWLSFLAYLAFAR